MHILSGILELENKGFIVLFFLIGFVYFYVSILNYFIMTNIFKNTITCTTINTIHNIVNT